MNTNWDHNKIVELIECYRNKPQLWDSRDNNYHLRNKKQDAWIDISLRFDTDVETIKGKMASLLSSFRREKARIRTRSGSGQSHWFAFNNFKFLLDKEEAVGSKRFKSEAGGESDNEYVEQEVGNSDGSLFTFDSPEDPIEATVTAYNTRSGSAKKKHNRYEEHVAADEGEYIFIKKQSKKDDSSIFAKHIAMKLRQFSDTSRKVVMHRINTVIFEEETKEFNLISHGHIIETTQVHIQSS